MIDQRKELISVIIPVYNIEEYLPRCLDTIAAQTYQNLEIILVDDGSTDDSGSICDGFAKRDKRSMVIHQKNQGLGMARNSGKRVAHGDYIMFVDGDDYLHVDAIMKLHAAICKDEGYDMAMCDCHKTKRLDENNKEILMDDEFNIFSRRELIYKMFSTDSYLFGVIWNKLYRKSLIDDFWSNNYIRRQDVDFNFRVNMNIRKAIFIHQKLYYYMLRTESLSHSTRTSGESEECSIDILFHVYKELPPDGKEFAPLFLRRLYRMMVNYKDKNYKTDCQDRVFYKCKEYETGTKKDFLKNEHIPLYEKVKYTVYLQFPLLTHFLFKVKNRMALRKNV